MSETSWSTTSRAGLSLAGRTWTPEGPKRAVIALVHGQGEHVGRYGHLAEWMGKRGIVVMGLDHPGHGLSEGRRGHIRSYEDYLETVELTLERCVGEFTGLPVCLYGQSMGGNIAAVFLLERAAAWSALLDNEDTRLLGGVLSSPWLRLAFEPPAFKLRLAGLMNSVWPAYSERNGLDADELACDTAVGKAYLADPLVHDKISARAFFELHAAGLRALAEAPKLAYPVLIMHGDADKITSHEASREFAERAGELARYRAFSGLRHELHNEAVQQEVFETVATFIEKQLGA